MHTTPPGSATHSHKEHPLATWETIQSWEHLPAATSHPALCEYCCQRVATPVIQRIRLFAQISELVYLSREVAIIAWQFCAMLLMGTAAALCAFFPHLLESSVDSRRRNDRDRQEWEHQRGEYERKIIEDAANTLNKFTLRPALATDSEAKDDDWLVDKWHELAKKARQGDAMALEFLKQVTLELDKKRSERARRTEAAEKDQTRSGDKCDDGAY